MGNLNTFSKDEKEYLLTFKLEKNSLGSLSISKEEQLLAKLDNADFDAFINSSKLLSNDNRIIYHSEYKGKGNILLIEK